MGIQCSYQSMQFSQVGARYTCVLTSLNITDRTEIKSLLGAHHPGRSNNDVEGLFAHSSVLHYIPSGVSKVFPRLAGISLINCSVKEISADALKGLDHLEELNVSHNHITSLPTDLFTGSRKMKWIDFSYNKLEIMSSRLLDSIPESQLVYVGFQQNTKLNVVYQPNSGQGPKSVGELQAAIFLGCQLPILEKKRYELKEKIWMGVGELWEHKRFSDFTVVVGTEEFQVHKCILAAQSSVFASMFEDDEQVKASNKLEIKDCSEEVVEDFLRALYIGDIENEENSLELFSLASIFDVQEIKSLAEHLAVENLNEENSTKALTLGNLYKSDVIIEAAFSKLKKIYSDVKFAEALKHKPERVEAIVFKLKQCREEIESLNSA